MKEQKDRILDLPEVKESDPVWSPVLKRYGGLLMAVSGLAVISGLIFRMIVPVIGIVLLLTGCATATVLIVLIYIHKKRKGFLDNLVLLSVVAFIAGFFMATTGIPYYQHVLLVGLVAFVGSVMLNFLMKR